MLRRVIVVILCVCVSVCLSVTMLAATCIPLVKSLKCGVIGLFMPLSRFSRVAFAENASFKCFGVIFFDHHCLPGRLTITSSRLTKETD